MCVGPELALLAGGVGTAATVVQGMDASRRSKHAAEDAKRERLQGEAEAAQRAQARTQQQRQALRANSLFTGGGEPGKTLGVG